MKLLLDQNLSARLVGMLDDVYPDSTHVRLVGMSTNDDEVIWHYTEAQMKPAQWAASNMQFSPEHWYRRSPRC